MASPKCGEGEAVKAARVNGARRANIGAAGNRFWTQSKICTSVVGMTLQPIDLLREHGLQVTAQRLAVMRALTGHPHSTADRVAELARDEIGAISRQSVYDTLALLADRGLVRRIQPPGSPAIYENRGADNHHHLICRDCGHLVDVECSVGDAPCLNISDDRGFVIDEADVAYWGRCPECQVTK